MKSVYTEGYRCVIKALIAARNSKGKTQQDIANILGKSQSYVAKYEVFERRIDIMELKLICDAINIDIHQIVEKMN